MRPEAEEYVGKYVRVLHDFDSTLPGELRLSKGDVLKVTSYVDKNWLKGKSGDREGSFPKDFVEKIHLPHTTPNQKLFAAIEKFPAQQDGDLGLQKGDVVIGLHPVDEFWWEGECNTVSGIFPITHVMEIEIPTLLRQRSRSVHSSEPLFAQALVDAVAQLDEELSFQAGDIIKVTEVIDEDWYMGECHGKSGMFLTSCVQLLNENECIESGRPSDGLYISHNSSPQTNTHQLGQTYEQSHVQGASQSQQHSIDRQSTENIGSNRVSSASVDRGISYSDSNAGVTPYARTLYQFIGENPDELSFEPNNIVTLIQHVDEQWIEGEIDGHIGLFPANFVEIVVDCPYAFITEQSSDLPTVDQKNLNENSLTDADIELPAVEITARTDNLTEETFALVLYSFAPETPQDLSVHEGETVTVIKKIDDNWILARNEAGQEGMCPMSFVEVIGIIPEFPHVSCDKNDNEIKSNIVVNNDTGHDASHRENELSVRVNGSDDMVKSVPDKLVDETEKDSAIGKTPSPGTVINKQIRKPGLKPKPLLAPKPVIKQKPLLSPKPFVNMNTNSKFVTFEASTMPKSASSKSLSTVGRTTEDPITMTKSQSMIDINKSKSNLDNNSQLETSDDTQESISSLESDKRNSCGQKTFEDWDMTKPLDSLIKSEFVRAKQEADCRSRSNSTRSSGSIVDTARKSHEQSVDYTDRPSRPSFSYQANYSRENFEAMEKGAFSVGNSVFFVNDFKPNERKLRKPPVPPNSRQDFNRRPSLKRAAPPRPVGPRITSQPARTPMVPSGSEQPPFQGSEITHAKGIPSRPQSGPRRHTRPAPPRPQGLSKIGSPPRPSNNDNLIRFSPPEPVQVTEDAEVEDDNETVQDLKSRIAGLEKDLEDFKRNKEELELTSQNVEEKDTEIHENLSFYEDNIQGITAEINLLKENLAEISPREKNRMAQEKAAILQKIEEEKFREAQRKKMEEEREERREKRIKVIDELIQTERDFITSLSLTMVTFLSPDVEKHPDVDLKLLFGNTDEVADVSQRLLTKLEEATNNKDFSEQVIGTCFITLAEDMKDVYAPYCRNHDDVINLTEKYKQNPDINTYLETLLDKLREQLTVFDLEALLIKPVQRVLKYPLLLNALLKATDEDHMDRKEVLNAINCMTDVATAINEYKRRKDLVFKYKKKETEALGEKLSKLSLHSIRKKSSRIRGRFSANLGFSDMTRDPVFEKEETSYRYLEKTVKVFVKDVQMYLQEAQEVVNVLENIAADIEDYYGEKRDMEEVREYQAFQNQVQMTFFPNFRMEVDDLVLLPLGQLSQMFEGPNKVIQKRYDKLLDYDNMKRKAQNDRVSEKALQIAKQDYEALNAQLLDELPHLYTLASQLFQDCVGSFVRAQREYQNCILQETYKLTDLQFLEEENILETFNIQHSAIVDKLAALSFMPRTFSPRVADLKQEKKNKRMSLDPSMLRSTDLVPQIDSQRVLLIQQYPKDKLYRVKGNTVASDPVDLSVCEGDVVGVIMEKDPMGNKDRWFVDNGVKKGFIARQALTLYDTSPPRRVSMPEQMLKAVSVSPSPSTGGDDISTPNNTVLDSVQDEDSMDFALEEDMTPEVPPGLDDELQQRNLYYAEYPFTARNENEVSLFEHQVVNVLAKHDQEGNQEWWYVEADGQYGYTPAIYLREMDSCEDPT